MPKFKLVVLTNPVAGQEDDFNEWYDNVHLEDVLEVPGVVGAERFRVRSGADTWRYMAIYDLDCDDPEALQETLVARAGTDIMPISDAMDMSNFYMACAETITPRRAA